MGLKRPYKITINFGTPDNFEEETKSITFQKLMKMISYFIKNGFKRFDYIDIQIEVMKE